MRFLWAFRSYPGCMGEQQSCLQDCDQPLARAPATKGICNANSLLSVLYART
ncbi:MAG: hypothetical protein LBK44_06620 [Spirochaetales bacterium]|nr:hypothetical protein [Spirochaetales bacterium]